MDGGGEADTFQQVIGNKPDAKLTSKSLGNQGMAVLGENQGIDTGGNEIVEQMARIIGRCANSDWWPQSAIIVGDDGGQALDPLPNAADVHRRNSSNAV